MKAKEFFFRDGFHAPSSVTAEQVAEELERIENITGKIDSPTIVEISKPEDAVLHPLFEWDESEAARKFREHQASNIATSVRVRYIDTGYVEPLRVSVKIEHEERRQYKTMAVVLSESDLIESARDGILRQLNGVKNTLDMFEDTLKRYGRSTTKVTQSRKHLQKAVAAIGGI